MDGQAGAELGILESTARREVLEEVGLPDGPQPRIAAPDEVAELDWLTQDEAATRPDCPPWMTRVLTAAAAALTDRASPTGQLTAAALAQG